MFKPIKRANKGRKFRMACAAEDKAIEAGYAFTGLLEANGGWAAYSAEFTSDDQPDEPFYGYAIASIDNGEYEEEIDFAFGSGQQIFGQYAETYILTDEDYYDIIGAGI
jgi:hypothetical protein